jgi:hypothetical protein
LKRFLLFPHYRDRRTALHRDINLGPSHDAFWIFVLWRALHGGDATLADIAAAVIANLSQYLPTGEDSFGLAPLPASPQFLAVSEIEESESSDFGSPEPESLDEDPLEPEQNSSDPSEQHARSCSNLFCSDPRELSVHHNYFKFKGVFYRVERPAFACLPTAA